jgi:hypothetical protein
MTIARRLNRRLLAHEIIHGLALQLGRYFRCEVSGQGAKAAIVFPGNPDLRVCVLVEEGQHRLVASHYDGAEVPVVQEFGLDEFDRLVRWLTSPSTTR